MENLKYDFDDVLIIPKKYTHVNSRYKDISLDFMLPLFTAPMDTVVNYDNKDVFLTNRINVALPRTVTYGDFLAKEILSNKTTDDGVFISLGFQDMDYHYKNDFKDFHRNAHILIDVANGHMQKVMVYAKELKRLRPDIKIMVGIGNGGGCLTTKQSGVGYPMASLIHEVRQEKILYVYDHSNDADFIFPPAIVADGGMKDYSDIIKALALGADYVMIGSIFNKALESAGDSYLWGMKIENRESAKYFFDRGLPVMKHFRGMSTKAAQKAMGKTDFKTSEGVVRYRRVEYHLQGWVKNFEHYLRNAMSYSNAKTLPEFIGKADICQITTRAHDRFNK